MSRATLPRKTRLLTSHVPEIKIELKMFCMVCLQRLTLLLTGVQNTDTPWYQSLMAPLSNDQKKQLQEIYSVSQQRRSTGIKGQW